MEPGGHKFEVLFDYGEKNALADPAYDIYGPVGFPDPPQERPWTYANFVQSIDGIASFGGKHPSGSAIAQSAEDSWLMDLLRAHADAQMIGLNTLLEDKRSEGAASRGPVYAIGRPELLELRKRLVRGREKSIVVTGNAELHVRDFALFDGDRVDAFIMTTKTGAEKLHMKNTPAHVRVLIAGEDRWVDLKRAVALLHQELGVRYLLCEGGPTLYGYMDRAGLIDEKFVTVSPVEIGEMVPPEQQPVALEKHEKVRLRPTTFNAPGFTIETAPWWRWMSCRKAGDHQFSRYRRKR